MCGVASWPHEAINAGCRRKIGNGANTKAWTVQWLSSIDNGFLNIPMPSQLHDITVQSFIDVESNKWDYDIPHDICNTRDVALIKRIPIPLNDRKDS